MPAPTPPVTRNTMGRTKTSTTAMRRAPITAAHLGSYGNGRPPHPPSEIPGSLSSDSLSDPCPPLDFDPGSQRETGHRERRTGWSMVVEGGDVRLVHGSILPNVGQKYARLHHVGHRCSLASEQRVQIGHGLGDFGRDTAVHQLPVRQPD